MSLLGVRNLDGMNDKIKQAINDDAPLQDPLNPSDVLSESIPYIVVIVDEFADMIKKSKGGKPAEKFIDFLSKFFESNDCNVKLKLIEMN